MHIQERLTPSSRGRTRAYAHIPERAETREQGRGLNRWVIYKQLCVAKSHFGLNDRCLAVLSSLLSFLPEDQIEEKKGLVVFPSNKLLSLRAHGMPESTLRRHLATLVEAGIIERKDSPTRKRYAHKDREGAVELAFGFSFTPLISRAKEITAAAEHILDAQNAQKRLRDEVSVVRRGIMATFDEIAPEARFGEIGNLYAGFRSIVDAIPRRASMQELLSIKAQLDAVQSDLGNILKNHNNAKELSGIVAQNERHHTESLPESLLESQNVQKDDLKANDPAKEAASNLVVPSHRSEATPLDMVLRACPDIKDYAPNGIASWRDLIDASHMVSRFLGIAQSTFLEARQVMGLEVVSAVVAWLLQRAGDIQSPGGYLRSLTHKAREGSFSITQILMTSLKANAVQQT